MQYGGRSVVKEGASASQAIKKGVTMKTLLVMVVTILISTTTLSYSASKEEAAEFIEKALSGCSDGNVSLSNVSRTDTVIRYETKYSYTSYSYTFNLLDFKPDPKSGSGDQYFAPICEVGACIEQKGHKESKLNYTALNCGPTMGSRMHNALKELVTKFGHKSAF